MASHVRTPFASWLSAIQRHPIGPTMQFPDDEDHYSKKGISIGRCGRDLYKSDLQNKTTRSWPLDEDLLLELIEKFHPRFAPWFEAKLPKTDQMVGVSLSRPKTAALIFDRVWTPPEFGWRLPENMVVSR